ncbi:hypothetical protein C9374_013456 [Naegleria lovaniensis]|uniref:non-specific serine/threonine protein kinase n=1 Tax=Naegleria lovaniensis TaxID=51637 RepID=A0AA88KPZ0_NAELO|nr:uncharacterized protein C9374_013456 [Naegleria lovaniensis]KAG2391971.1 hypothetical protein C9374_013456 [Naegleria lovaniensis]
MAQQPKHARQSTIHDTISQKTTDYTSENWIDNTDTNNYLKRKKLIWLTLGLGWIPTLIYGFVSLFWFLFLSIPFLPFGLQIYRIFKFMQFPFSLSEFSSSSTDTHIPRFFFQRYYDPKLIQLLFSRDKTSTLIKCANRIFGGLSSKSEREENNNNNLIEGIVATSPSSENQHHHESKHDAHQQPHEDQIHPTSTPNHNMLTEFFQYIRNGNNEMVESMIMSGRVDANSHDLSGTALGICIELANMKMMKFLVRRGANVNGQVYGRSLLNYALERNHVDFARYLIRKGANPKTVTLQNSNIATIVNDVIVAQVEKFNRALKNHDFKRAEYLLKKNYKSNILIIDCLNFIRETPLYDAAKYNNTAAIEWLIQHGATIDLMVLETKLTPLQVAIQLKCFDAIRTLVQYGANIYSKDGFGMTCEEKARNAGFDLSQVVPTLKKDSPPSYSEVMNSIPYNSPNMIGSPVSTQVASPNTSNLSPSSHQQHGMALPPYSTNVTGVVNNKVNFQPVMTDTSTAPPPYSIQQQQPPPPYQSHVPSYGGPNISPPSYVQQQQQPNSNVIPNFAMNSTYNPNISFNSSYNPNYIPPTSPPNHEQVVQTFTYVPIYPEAHSTNNAMVNTVPPILKYSSPTPPAVEMEQSNNDTTEAIDSVEVNYAGDEDRSKDFDKEEPKSLEMVLKERYSKMTLIGRGSNGYVYKAKKRIKPKETSPVYIAVKLIDFFSTKELNRSIKTAMNLMKLRNENIIRVTEVCILKCKSDPTHNNALTDKSTLCIEMDYYEKGTMDILIKQRCTISETVLKKFIFQIASALCYLSDNKLVHRNIKPHNILLKEWDPESDIIVPCLIGFRLSKSTDSDNDLQQAGSLQYLPPELLDISEELEDTALFTAADIYAFGITCYQMMTHDNVTMINGLLIKYGSEEKVMQQIRSQIKKHQPVEYSDQLIDLVLRMLQFNGHERITSYEIVELIQHI